MNLKRQITGRHVLIGMLAFFGVIFAVNGVFLYYAMDTWPGLTTDRAYVQGLEYNKVLEAAEDQNLRGWRSAVAIEGEAGTRRLTVRLTDRSDRPLTGMAVDLDVRRPVGAEPGMAVSVREVAPGLYRTEPVALGDGRWRVAVSVGDAFHMNHEIWVAP